MRKTIVIANLVLLLATFLSASNMIPMKLAAGDLGGFAFNLFRSIAAVAVMSPIIFYRYNRRRRKAEPSSKKERKSLLISGSVCGLLFCLENTFVVIALRYADAGRVGFILSLFVVIVPLLSLLIGKRLKIENWIGVTIALIGLYFFSFSGSAGFNVYELLPLLTALMMSVRILVVERYSNEVSPVDMVYVKFLFNIGFSFIGVILFETIMFESTLVSIPAILYTGIIGGAITFALQTYAQKNVAASSAALILCTSSVFSAILAVILLGESFSLMESLGAVLILVSSIVSQITIFSNKKKKGIH